MAMRPEISYEYNTDGIDVILEESSNSVTAIREIRWNDSSDYRLDIRKYFVSSDGDVRPGKGISFSDTAGPARLTLALVDNGFGDTQELMNAMSVREDFIKGFAKTFEDTPDKEFMSILETIERERKTPEECVPPVEEASAVLDSILK